MISLIIIGIWYRIFPIKKFLVVRYKCTNIGPQRRLRIYIGYESPSIIRYLKPQTGDIFTARFADWHFNEAIFPSLAGEKQLKKGIIWSESFFVASWSSHKTMWIRNAKYYVITRNNKSIARRVHWYKKSD